MDTRERMEALREELVRYVRAKFSTRPGVCGLAEDIVQQAFTEAAEEKWCFPYLSKVCLHEAYRCFKRQDALGRSLDDGEALWFLDDRDVEAELFAAQDAGDILDSLQILREIERVIVTQRYYGDYSFAQIASQNGMKLSTVLSHHRRALEKLRPRLVGFSEGRTGRKTSRERGMPAALETRPQAAFPSLDTVSQKGRNTMTGLTQYEAMEFSLLAERAHRLAFDIAMQSGQMGEDGHGVAAVADECRSIGNRLKQAAARLLRYPEEGLCVEEEILELEMLAVNGSIEMLWFADSKTNVLYPRALAVVFDELRHLTDDVRKIIGRSQPRAVCTEASPLNRVIQKRMPFVQMKVGGAEYTENLRMVREVVRYSEENVGGGILRLRGRQIRVLHTERLPEGKGVPTFLILVCESYQREDEAYALPVDTLPDVFWSGVGVSTPCGPFVRECWGCEEDRSMRFLDYGKLL